MRMILFVDYQPNAASPTTTAIFDGDGVDTVNGSALPVAACSYSHLNLNNRDRFKILWDKTFTSGDRSVSQRTLGGTPYGIGITDGKDHWSLKKFVRCNVDVVYNGINGGTAGDVTSGALFLLQICNQAGQWGSFVNVRTHYKDV